MRLAVAVAERQMVLRGRLILFGCKLQMKLSAGSVREAINYMIAYSYNISFAFPVLLYHLSTSSYYYCIYFR